MRVVRVALHDLRRFGEVDEDVVLVAEERERAAGAHDARHLGPERGVVEPVRCLRGDDGVDAAGREVRGSCFGAAAGEGEVGVLG